MLTVTVLGSGGNSPIPTPTCGCRVCEEARTGGIPYARHGNSLYLEELSALVDAPEFVYENLEREGVDDLEYLFLTHWHPDHSAGLRVLQSRSMERMFEEPDQGLVETARRDRPTLVTTRRVYERTCEVYAGLRHYVEDVGFAETHFLDEAPLVVECGGPEQGGETGALPNAKPDRVAADADVDAEADTDGEDDDHADDDGDVEPEVELDAETEIEVDAVPYSLSGDGDVDATAFVIRAAGTTVVLATDDARYLDEGALPDDVDLAVFECGYFRETPDGTRILTDADEALLADELTHDEVMRRVDRVDARRTLLTEIEHLYGRGYDDYRELERDYERVEFAYDGLTVRV